MNRNGGRSITEMIQRSAKKAIKQGEAGLAGKRSLSELLDNLLQDDVVGFLKAVAPYCPREIILDQSISITVALEEARSRMIDLNTINHLASDQPAIEHQDCTTLPLQVDQAAVVDV